MQELAEMMPIAADGQPNPARRKSTLIAFSDLALFVGHRVIVEHRRPDFLDTVDRSGGTYFSEKYEAEDPAVHSSHIGTLVGAELRSSFDPEKAYSIRYIVLLGQGNGPVLRIPMCEGDEISVAGYDHRNAQQIVPIADAKKLSIHRRSS